ncbi:MAG TPA: SRPBCC family protein [Roseiflexaceae bacterium]|nr:SRPBCC family protein [Roseiflexaceae bacterium]
MSYVEHETTIDAPPETVFAALLDIQHAPAWVVNLEEVRNITGSALGDSFEWTFRMAGLPFKGRTVFTALTPNEHLREEGSGDLTSTWDWRLAPEGEGTRVKVGIDYTVPGGALIGAALNKLFVERQNEKDLRQTLENLRRRLEQ